MKRECGVRKAMVLAAGLGTRFLPLSRELPKPLLPFFNVPLVYHTLNWLKDNGIKQVIINLHHLPELIQQALGKGRRWGLQIEYSYEPELLGTGGGLKKVAGFFAGERFVLVNSDVYLQADLAPALDFHARKGALATMLLARGDTRRYGTIGVDQAGRICRVPWERQVVPAGGVAVAAEGVCSGVHILQPEVFDYLPPGISCINREGYEALLAAGRPVYACFWPENAWCDLGEPDAYLKAHRQMMKKGLAVNADFVQVQAGIWLAQGEELPRGAELVPPVAIGRGCRLAAGSRVGPYAVLGDRVQVQKGAVIESSVLLDESEVGGQKLKGVIRGRSQEVCVSKMSAE